MAISTHAPAGGATRLRRVHGDVALYFYSRPCGRGDAAKAGENTAAKFISTHAPAGGATVSGIEFIVGPIEFLLTPLREGRRAAGQAHEQL